MGRNEEELRRMEDDCVKQLCAIKEECGAITEHTVAEFANQSNIAGIALMLSRIADTLEEINEKLDKKTDGGYLVCGDNLRIIHCDTGTDDGK